MVAPFPASAEHLYFLEIETLFNALRGSAALLSPADWQIAQGWWRRRVPLTLVQSALENVFRQRRERGETDRIQRLSYCQPAVDNAFQHLLELGFGEHPVTAKRSIEQRLRDLVVSLGAFGGEHEAEIIGCGDGMQDAAAVERNLAALETRLARKASATLEDDSVLAVLEERLSAAVEPLRGRLDPKTLQRTRSRTRDRLLRELMGIPDLSLFAENT